ncbi:MAG: fused signal recognition particle receptor [Oceanicoccus sp.]|jgi:fused signal recognition particle receptor
MKFFDRFKSKRKDDESDVEILQAEESESLEAPISDATHTDSLEPSGFDDSIVTVESGSLSDAHSPLSGEQLENIEVEPAAAREVGEDLAAEDSIDAKPEKSSFFGRLKHGLKRTGGNFSDGMGSLLLGKKEINDDLFEELETQLLMADIGVEATQEIVNNLAQRVSRKELSDREALYVALQEELASLLAPSFQPLEIDATHKPYVILMVGVNGVGKTTTIGKLTKRFQSEGKSVMLAAGDTFRAAAVEQLQVWGERHNVPVIAQQTGADSASVIFDAVQAAQARNVDVLIADTAGRLHNKDNLMEELKKIVRVMQKLDSAAPHEVMLVLDAGTGQNAMVQAKSFQEVVGVTGITLTKLDGTAKGGIIFAISKQLKLPIRFIGVGEQSDDLRPFVIDDFVAALFDRDEPRV